MRKLGFRVFFIGFNKCGTVSLHKWLSDCGVNSLHGGTDKTAVHNAILLNVALGRPALFEVDDCDAYLDVSAIASQFRAIDRDYPSSKFVFNTRDVDRWVVSRLNHAAGGYVNFMNLAHGLNLTASEWADRWRNEFRIHELNVTQHFQGRADFLRFDIERDRPKDLAVFLGLDLATAPEELPRENTTANKHYGFSDGKIVPLAEREIAAEQRDRAIEQRDAAVAERNKVLAEREATIAARDHALASRNAMLAERGEFANKYASAAAECAALARERDNLIEQRDSLIEQCDSLMKQRDNLIEQRDTIARACETVAAEMETIRRSRSWRITAPLRSIRAWAARLMPQSSGRSTSCRHPY